MTKLNVAIFLSVCKGEKNQEVSDSKPSKSKELFEVDYFKSVSLKKWKKKKKERKSDFVWVPGGSLLSSSGVQVGECEVEKHNL